MSQNALAFILMDIESRRHGSSALDNVLHEGMVEFTPKLSQPHSKSEVEALAHVFAQPEMQAFWSNWKSSRALTARGPHPSDPGAKAMACMLGMTKHNDGLGAYGDPLEMERPYGRPSACPSRPASVPVRTIVFAPDPGVVSDHPVDVGMVSCSARQPGFHMSKFSAMSLNATASRSELERPVFRGLPARSSCSDIDERF
jgi:hypothetical protein